MAKTPRPKCKAWDRKHGCQERTADFVQLREGVPNGRRTVDALYDQGDTFLTHLQKCVKWYELVKTSYPDHRLRVMTDMIAAITERWPKEAIAFRKKFEKELRHG